MSEKIINAQVDSVSRFVVPFHLDYKYEKKHKVLFAAGDWQVEVKYPRYITKYMQEIFNSTEGRICTFYKLNEEKREELNLPIDTVHPLYVESNIIEGNPRQHVFWIVDISAAYFSTGIGFVFIDVGHQTDDSFEEIVDRCFALSNIFTNEHDNSGRESRLKFYYEKDEQKVFFSLKNCIYDILKTQQLKDRLEIFPTSQRRKMNAYHRIFRESMEEGDQECIDFLAKGRHSASIAQQKRYDFLESDFIFSNTRNTSWCICPSGVVSLTYDEEMNQHFLTQIHPRNVDVDYFLVFLFALHEREILLKYNYDAVRNWNNPKKLMEMKEKLIRFNLWFSYNTVSVEMSYQNFYECLYKALKLEKLETDIQDVIVKVNEYVNAQREKKINGILTAIALLAVISAVTDGISLVDRVYDEMPFQTGHFVILAFIIVVIGCGIYCFLRRKK